MYKPKPEDTSNISIPTDLQSLIEKIAENVHEVWAAQRISEGWVYGQVKDSSLKTTPCLVPYNELPESEKEYDRSTAVETIKLVIKFGYEIRKK